MKSTDESKKVRFEIAEAINESPNNIANYDWFSITDYFQMTGMAGILKYVEDDDVLDQIEKCILNAFTDVRKHKDPNLTITYDKLKYNLESVKKIRILFRDLEKYRQRKKDKSKNQCNAADKDNTVASLETENKALKAENKQLKQDNHLLKEENEQLKAQTTESGEQEWKDWLDDVFHPSINAEEVAKTIHDKKSPHLTDRCNYYVAFRVLSEIHWIPKPEKRAKAFLKWANAHFHCGWDWRKDDPFKFTDIDDNIKKTSIFDWDENTMDTKMNGKYYRGVADSLMNSFITLIDGKYYLDNNPYIKPGHPYVNNGKK